MSDELQNPTPAIIVHKPGTDDGLLDEHVDIPTSPKQEILLRFKEFSVGEWMEVFVPEKKDRSKFIKEVGMFLSKNKMKRENRILLPSKKKDNVVILKRVQ